MTAISNFVQRLPRWFFPAMAMLVGLVLGLLIGWVWWPVQWSSATISELSPAAQATYLSAVADAYVADGDPTNAAAVRTERLAPLGDDPATALLDAIAWFQSHPVPDNVRINNLAIMASELGATVTAQTLATSAELVAPVGPDLAPDAAQTAAADSAAATTSGGERWRWVLGLLGALALIGGGAYLYHRATREPVESSRYMPLPIPAAAPGASYDPRPVAPRPAAAPSAPAAPQPAASQPSAWSTTVVKPASGAAVGPGDDLAFDNDADDFGDDEDDDLGDDDLGDEGDEAAAWSAGAQRPTGPSASVESADELRSATYAARYGATGTPASSPQQPQQPPKPTSPWSQPSASAAVLAAPTAVKAVATAPAPAPAPQKMNPLARLATAVAPKAAPAAHTAPVAVPGAARPQTAPQPARQPRAGRTLLANLTCQYAIGANGYVEPFTLSDPATGMYVGECGMGVSLRNAALHHNPNQVIALEVWLTDNNQVAEDFSTTARVLLSDYAAGKDYAPALLKDREGSVRTMMTRPGARFTLEGKHLQLEANVEEVQYDDQGIFRVVRVAMQVYRK